MLFSDNFQLTKMYIVLYLPLVLTSFICVTQLPILGNWYSPVNWYFYNPWLKVNPALQIVVIVSLMPLCLGQMPSFLLFSQCWCFWRVYRIFINITPYGFVWFFSLKLRLCIRLLQKWYSLLRSSLEIT